MMQAMQAGASRLRRFKLSAGKSKLQLQRKTFVYAGPDGTQAQREECTAQTVPECIKLMTCPKPILWLVSCAVTVKHAFMFSG